MVGLPKVGKLRIAVVGAGAFGRNHLRIIHESDYAVLAGVFDVNPDRSAEAARQHWCPVFHNLSELASHADAAVVSTPTVTHADIGVSLIELGLDVLVEKPIAHNSAGARALIDAAARHGRILQSLRRRLQPR